MPTSYDFTPQELADLVREAIVGSFDIFTVALERAGTMPANEFREILQDGRADLEAALIHGLEQAAAELRDQV